MCDHVATSLSLVATSGQLNPRWLRCLPMCSPRQHAQCCATRHSHSDQPACACRSILIGSSAAMIFLNFRGLDIVGHAAEVTTLLTLLPFAVLALVAIPHMKPSQWLEVKPAEEIDWINYFNILFWCLNSWDSISTLAGEVRNPGKLMPRAFLFGVPLVRRSSLHCACEWRLEAMRVLHALQLQHGRQQVVCMVALSAPPRAWQLRGLRCH